MLFTADLHDRIKSGEITVAFRNWKRPTITEGGTLTTPVGVLRIDELQLIDPTNITDTDAQAAGFANPEAALASLRPGRDRRLYRIRFHRESDDPRIELRTRTELSDTERRKIRDQLARWDAVSRTGEWTQDLLNAIAEHPGERSTDLADRLDTGQAQLKRRVRLLKGLGLTESLGTGYRLSEAGRHYRGGL